MFFSSTTLSICLSSAGAFRAMSHLFLVVEFVLCFGVFNGIAAVLPSQTSSLRTSTTFAKGVTTTAPARPSVDDLRRRQYYPNYICGYDSGAINTISCIDTALSCMATLLPNGQAYQYCSTPGAAAQAIATSAIPYGRWTYCPDYTLCWYVSAMARIRDTASNL
jgi:hypothetical protein